MQEPIPLHCNLEDDGLYLTYSDGKTFFYPQAFLFATRFTHAQIVSGEPINRDVTPLLPSANFHAS